MSVPNISAKYDPKIGSFSITVVGRRHTAISSTDYHSDIDIFTKGKGGIESLRPIFDALKAHFEPVADEVTP